MSIYPAGVARVLLTARVLWRDRRASPVKTGRSQSISINTSLLHTLLQATSHTHTRTVTWTHQRKITWFVFPLTREIHADTPKVHSWRNDTQQHGGAVASPASSQQDGDVLDSRWVRAFLCGVCNFSLCLCCSRLNTPSSPLGTFAS